MRVKALFLYFMFDGAVTNCEQAHKHLQNLVQQSSAEESPVKLFILNYERTVQKVINTCEYNPQKVAAAAGLCYWHLNKLSPSVGTLSSSTEISLRQLV